MTVGGDVYLVDRGPDEASTSLALVVRCQPIFDTNGYYRALGISADATRREIREAYQRLNGQKSPRLTYIVKQLLNPEVRAKYDGTPLGSLFLDEEIETWQRRARASQVSSLIEQGHDDLAEELAGTDLGALLDGSASAGQDDHDSPLQPVWGWGYYLHSSQCNDTARLDLWQQYLVSALGRLRFEGKVAVGFSGVMATPWGVARVGSRVLVLLHEDEWPTEALAREVASRMVEPEVVRSADRHEHGDKDMSAPNFRRGTEEAKSASKGGANFARTEYFRLDDGKSTTLRFLTEPSELIVVDQHQMIPTKKEPFDGWPKDAKWADKRGAVCRNDVAFKEDPEAPSQCFICDNIVDGKKIKKPSARNWALACIREEVRENGVVAGYRDAVREVKITRDGKEETIKEKQIVIVNMGYKNFFAVLEGFFGRYKTLLDRDYYIKRDGDDQDTTYQIVPNDPIQAKNPDGELEILDLRQPHFMDRYKHSIDLAEVVADLASEEFYAKFFDTRYTVVEEKDGDKHTGYKIVPSGSAPPRSSGSSESSAPAEQGSGDIDGDRMAALASRVKGYQSGSTASTGSDAAPAAEPVAQPASAGPVDFG